MSKYLVILLLLLTGCASMRGHEVLECDTWMLLGTISVEYNCSVVEESGNE